MNPNEMTINEQNVTKKKWKPNCVLSLGKVNYVRELPQWCCRTSGKQSENSDPM